MSKSPPAIGIDLGTTYTVLAICENEEIKVIPNELGNRTTPSWVAFTDDERIVGDGALHKAALNPENTIYGVKRLIGRDFDDPAIQDDIKHWPFEVANENGKIKIRVMYKREKTSFYPEEISSMVLERMKQIAEAYLQRRIKDVVITVPAYFNNGQRQATKFAAEIANLNVVRIINEPTAAAMAYGLHTRHSGNKNILIYDFGGGTFDVSIVKIANFKYDVLATNGDTHLGGDDFDLLLMKYFIEDYARKYNQDITNDKRLMSNLRKLCENAKRILSTAKNVEMVLEGTQYKASISRARFEYLCESLFEKSINLVSKALSDAKMTKSQIDDIILVGGSSRIPRLQEMLTEFFDGKALNKKIDPDECVAYGAAVQAAMLQEQSQMSYLMRQIELQDVCPLSIGSEILDGSLTIVIRRNTHIPCKETKTFVTVADNQTSASIHIYEGERVMAKDNHFLGSFVLDRIPPAPRGVSNIIKTFEIDENGILTISATEPTSGHTRKLTIENKSRLDSREVTQIVQKAEELRADDERARECLEVWNELERYLYDVQRKVRNSQDYSSGDAATLVTEFQKWLDDNKMASKNVLQAKKRELEDLEQVWMGRN